MCIGLVGCGTGGPRFHARYLAAAQGLNLVGTDRPVPTVLAGRRPADDLVGWRFGKPDLWGTLNSEYGADRMPPEQGCYATSDDAFARAVRRGSSLPATAGEAVQILAVPNAPGLGAAERSCLPSGEF